MAKTISGQWSTDVTNPITTPSTLAIGCTISGANPTFTALCAGVSSVTIDLSCSDIGTGCATNFPKRKIDNSATDPGISTYSASNNAVLSPTNYRVWFYSEDIQGNQETPNSLTVTFTYSISGNVIVDYDHDCTSDAIDTNYSGTPTTTSTAGTVTNNTGGIYSVNNIAYGTSPSVTLTIPANYVLSNTCTIPITNPNPYAPGAMSSNLTHDFYITPLYSISGNVFIDTDKDGRKDTSPVENNYSNSPTETVTIDGSTDLTITPASGIYQTGANLLSGQYEVSFITPDNYNRTYPLSGTPPTFTVTVGFACSVYSYFSATCASGNISDLNFGITNSIPWFQGKGADMRKDSGFGIMRLPLNAYFSEDGAGLTPGVIFSPGTTLFGNGSSSSKEWIVNKTYNSSLKSKLSYDYIKSKVGSGGTLIDNTVCTGGLSNCTLDSSLTAGVYYTDGASLTLNAFNPTPAAADYIFIIDGDLTIEDNIIIPVGSTATFIARNDIRVVQDVDIDAAGNSTACAIPGSTIGGCQVEGFFSAGRNLTVNGNGESGCYSGTVDKRLNMSGAIIVNANREGGSFTNNRDLCDQNLSYPSFHITERVDFLLNAPNEIKINTNYWQEVAP